jgi:hypothetical protein
VVRLGRQGSAWHGSSWRGWVRQARLGLSGLGLAGRGVVRQARSGKAIPARLGVARQAAHVRASLGLARQVAARRGSAGSARHPDRPDCRRDDQRPDHRDDAVADAPLQREGEAPDARRDAGPQDAEGGQGPGGRVRGRVLPARRRHATASPVLAFKAATVGGARFYGKRHHDRAQAVLFFRGEVGDDGRARPDRRRAADARGRRPRRPWRLRPALPARVPRVALGPRRDLRHVRADPRLRPLADRRGRHGRRRRRVAPEKNGDFGTYRIDPDRPVEVVS